MKLSREAVRKAMLLYAVTDRKWAGAETLLEQAEKALKGGATCLQLREKELSDAEFLAEALQMKDLCRRFHVPFIVNDNVEVAIKCGADGVHVGQDDMAAADVRKLAGPDMILGVSARTAAQAAFAQENGADYLGVGAVFATSTKLDALPVSREELKTICETVAIPVVARLVDYRPKGVHTEVHEATGYDRFLGTLSVRIARNPLPLLAVVGLVALVGVALDSSIPISTDEKTFVPQDMPALVLMEKVGRAQG